MRRHLSVTPDKAAALFIDLQEEHRQDERYLVAEFETIMANVRDLQRAARSAGSRSSMRPMSLIRRSGTCGPSIP